jgi:hypothetical protein
MVRGLDRLWPKEIRSRQGYISEESQQTRLKTNFVPPQGFLGYGLRHSKKRDKEKLRQNKSAAKKKAQKKKLNDTENKTVTKIHKKHKGQREVRRYEGRKHQVVSGTGSERKKESQRQRGNSVAGSILVGSGSRIQSESR